MKRNQSFLLLTLISILSISFLYGCGNDDITGCIAEGTYIMTPTGEKLIEDVQIGDIVYSFNIVTQQLNPSKVIFKKELINSCYNFQISENTSLTATLTHPIYSPETDSYELAEKWLSKERTNFAVFTNQNSIVNESAVSIKSVGNKRVFDITVDSPNANFIANGFLVHNKSVAPNDTPPVDDLEVISKSDSSLTLSWTVPGNSSVFTAEYILWQADSIDATDGGWLLDSVLNMPTPKSFGSKDTLEIKGLESQKRYLFTMQTFSNHLELSGFGNSVIDTTL